MLEQELKLSVEGAFAPTLPPGAATWPASRSCPRSTCARPITTPPTCGWRGTASRCATAPARSEVGLDREAAGGRRHRRRARRGRLRRRRPGGAARGARTWCGRSCAPSSLAPVARLRTRRRRWRLQGAERRRARRAGRRPRVGAPARARGGAVPRDRDRGPRHRPRCARADRRRLARRQRRARRADAEARARARRAGEAPPDVVVPPHCARATRPRWRCAPRSHEACSG